MDITEKELFEMLGKQQVQIVKLTQSLNQYREYAVKLQAEIDDLKKPSKKKK